MKPLRKHQMANAFLLEILLDILLFAILLIVILNLFIKAHRLTNQTEQLHQAVSICADIADMYQSSDGQMDAIKAHYPNCNLSDAQSIIYLNDDFTEASRDEHKYKVVVSQVDASALAFNGSAIEIECFDADNHSIYKLRACHYNAKEVAYVF